MMIILKYDKQDKAQYPHVFRASVALSPDCVQDDIGWEMYKWCRQSFGVSSLWIYKRDAYNFVRFLFQKDSDAALFKMRWG
jgi:hypothetical protein